MTLPRDVVILSAARTPIGRYGGAFRDVHPAELGAVAVRAALERAGVEPSGIDELLFGQARQAGSGPNPARQVVRRAGLPDRVHALTINKACASGLQAIASAAVAVALGDAEVVVAGGMESMSRVPYLIDAEHARWGHRLGPFALVDAMYRDGLRCPLSGLVMGETAEVLAHEYGITRDASDRFAFDSQQKAARAIAGGRLAGEIAPVPVADANGRPGAIETDEHPRPGTTLAALQTLPPVFPDVEGRAGIITAGSSSGITDGAAALVLSSMSAAEAVGAAPLARILGWSSAGVDPRIMGIGPVPAVRRLCERTGLTLDAFDLIEINEAFAAQVLAVLHDLPVPADRVNVNGGAIALGHPIGCTGARMLVTLLAAMVQRRARLGLATLCVSGGLGMAMAVERL